jgi:hypothetical protein
MVNDKKSRARRRPAPWCNSSQSTPGGVSFPLTPRPQHVPKINCTGFALVGQAPERDMESLSETPKIRPSETSQAKTTLPRCPECGSYALYRDGRTGPYECLTCEQIGIPEDAAKHAGVVVVVHAIWNPMRRAATAPCAVIEAPVRQMSAMKGISNLAH